jgi:hypothetical protein
MVTAMEDDAVLAYEGNIMHTDPTVCTITFYHSVLLTAIKYLLLCSTVILLFQRHE